LETKEYTREVVHGLLKKISPDEINQPNKELILVRVFTKAR
jgi:hypothetical protein